MTSPALTLGELSERDHASELFALGLAPIAGSVVLRKCLADQDESREKEGTDEVELLLGGPIDVKVGSRPAIETGSAR